MYLGPGVGSSGYAINVEGAAFGTITMYYTSTFTGTAYLWFYGSVPTASTYILVNSISGRLAEPDRSVNNNGLAVYGTITKSAVATGSNLVAYSGFPGNGASKTNYLQQPYNSSLNFGTTFCFMGWMQINASTGVDQHFFDLTNASGQNRINI